MKITLKVNAKLLKALVFLSEHDLPDIMEAHEMAQADTEQRLNDVIDTLTSNKQVLIPALTALMADDATQTRRATALQAALDALNASPNTVDQAHADTLRGFLADLTPVLTSLVPPAAPVAPVTVVPPIAPVTVVPPIAPAPVTNAPGVPPSVPAVEVPVVPVAAPLTDTHVAPAGLSAGPVIGAAPDPAAPPAVEAPIVV